MVEAQHQGGLVRHGGVLTPVPAAWKTRSIDFGRGTSRSHFQTPSLVYGADFILEIEGAVREDLD